MKLFNSHALVVGLIIFCIVFAENQDIKVGSHVKNSFIKMLKNIIKANENRMNTLKKITQMQDYAMSKTRTTFPEDDETKESAANVNTIIEVLNILAHDGTSKRTRKSNDQGKPATRIIFLNINDQNRNTKVRDDRRIEPKPADKIMHRESKEVENSEGNTVPYNFEHSPEHKGVNVEMTDDERKIGYTVKGKKVDISIEDIRRNWMSSCSKKAAKACKKACVDAHKSFCRTYSCSSRAKKRFRTECKYSCKSKFNDNRYSDIE